ncbi:uncharacterized protein LOC133185337 [Saccostrea echinata]|uniref:uncharacterized protein LOC133185337 n=1 Tax=Saccostrea echinata TaxID=191078 RepID=UPI002A831C01|nr:uncharacterized protein LOC133185337 [Saccostrea echinata]
MSHEHWRHRRAYSDGQRPRSHHLPLKDLPRKYAVTQSDENLAVPECPHMPRSSSMQSLNTDFVDAASDDSFQKEVAEKTQMYFVGKQEAETEVFLDRIIKKEGSKDRALLFIVSEIMNENKVQMLINSLLHRGANPSASNKDMWTPLHYAVKKNYKGVCSKLLEHEAWPDARDKKGVMPYTLAFEAGNDDIAAMLITYMSNEFVRKIYSSDKNAPAEFSFHTLLNKNMQKTILAVLDCMIDPVSPSGDVCVYYNVLEADGYGRVPTDSHFNPRSKSGLQIIAKSGNKTIVYHDVVRLLIRRKWKEYARFRFLINSLFYIITLITITFSAIVASSTPDPSVYDLSALQIGRAVCEIWSLGMAILTLFSELNQLRKHRLEYWQDAFNWIDLSSSILIIIILPLRFTQTSEQWFVFSAAYLLWTVRIFKYAAVFRQTGAYAQILWRILIHDIFQFTTFFLFILLAFSGCLLLSLRGEGSLEQFHESSSFWSILFVGVRILIEAERIIEYTELQTMSLIIMVVFLFTICVLLLNILIAQLSDTYQNVQQDAQRGLEVNRAWIVARVELNSLYIGQGHRTTHYKESENIYDVRDVLEKWESPPLNEMNKYIQDIWEGLDSHKMNLLTIRNRLARQESALSKIQDTLDKLLELEEKRQELSEFQHS